jgi:hypothetical protein
MFPFSEKNLSQFPMGHLKGLSPVCVFMCVLRVAFLEKELSQSWHLKGLMGIKNVV